MKCAKMKIINYVYESFAVESIEASRPQTKLSQNAIQKSMKRIVDSNWRGLSRSEPFGLDAASIEM